MAQLNVSDLHLNAKGPPDQYLHSPDMFGRLNALYPLPPLCIHPVSHMHPQPTYHQRLMASLIYVLAAVKVITDVYLLEPFRSLVMFTLLSI